MNNHMTTTEAVCWSIFIGGMLFFLDAWLTNLHEDSINPKIQMPPMIMHTDREKEILCKAWPTCEELSRALVYESRGEGRQGMKAVAFVIQNRVKHHYWPDTIEEVIHQPRQFSFLQDWHRQKTPSKNDWTTARAVAYNVLHEKVEDITQGATHYTEVSIQRSWMKNLELVGVVGKHKFFRGNN